MTALYTPDAERIATTNAWAFLHRWRRGGGWPELIRWSAEDPAGFAAALREFAADDADPAWIARTLLHADLRPDDHVLLAAPWDPLPGFAVTASTPDTLLEDAARCRATVLAAGADALGRLAQPPADLPCLRTVIALGGPMAAEARARLYTAIGPQAVLLAQDGDRLWGSPLDPVPLEPGSPQRFFAA